MEEIIALIVLVVLLVSIVVFIMFSPSSWGELVEFTWEGKTYRIPEKYRDFAQKALQGDEKSKYEIVTQYYEGDKPFIPELCFKFVCELAEKDLGVLTQLGEMYLNGVGTPKDEEKARAAFERALELYDNPVPGVYIPEESKEYRDFLVKNCQLREIKK